MPKVTPISVKNFSTKIPFGDGLRIGVLAALELMPRGSASLSLALARARDSPGRLACDYALRLPAVAFAAPICLAGAERALA